MPWIPATAEPADRSTARREAGAAATRARVVRGLLLAGLGFCYLAGLGVRPLVAPDEFRYAEVPREMIASGDWVVPRLDGVLYLEKPILGYWVTALSMRVFGEHAAAVRLPFALSSLLAAAIVFALVRRYGPGGAWAYAAAIGFLTSLEVAAISTAAVLDALFSFVVTASLAAFFAATQRQQGVARQTWLAVSGVACGVGFLTKGLLAFAIPAVVAVPYLISSRRSRELLLLPWTPVAVALAIAAPWSVAIASAEPDFWRQFLVNEHLGRFIGGPQAHHAEPFWFYLPALAAGALPWTSLLVPALRRRAALASAPLARFAICWLAAPLCLLSLASGKLVTYLMPCFAPLFVLIACSAAAQPPARLERHLGQIATMVGVLCATVALALVSPLPAVFGVDAYLAADEAWKPYAAAAGLLAAGACAWAGRRAPSATARATAIGAAISLACALATVVFPTGLTHKTPEDWLATRVDPIPRDAIVVTDRHLVQAVCWHLRRDDALVLGSAGELRDGLERADQRARWLDDRALDTLIRDPARTRPLVVIGRTDRSPVPPGLAPARSDVGRTAFFVQYDPVALP